MRQKVLLNDFQRQWADLGGEVMASVARVGASGWYILGKSVQRFEADLSTHWGVAHGVGCANGLDAIEIGLRAQGIKVGDRVLTTPLSAFATTLAILRCGGVPVFVDVDESGLMDLDQAEAVLAADGRIRYMVPVHLYGHPLSLTRLQALRDRFGLQVIEDCAQAVAATSGGRMVGSVGQAAATSFYPTKNLGALGDAGALLSNDAELAERARCIRDYGQGAKYEHVILGLNSRLDEIHAEILNSAMLPRLSVWTARRRHIASYYLRAIRHPDVRVVCPPAGSDSAWHLFPLLIAGGKRDQLKSWLASQGVQSAVHYPRLITSQQALLSLGEPEIHYGLGTAERFAADELSIPIHPYLDDGEIAAVVEAINGWEA